MILYMGDLYISYPLVLWAGVGRGVLRIHFPLILTFSREGEKGLSERQ